MGGDGKQILKKQSGIFETEQGSLKGLRQPGPGFEGWWSALFLQRWRQVGADT